MCVYSRLSSRNRMPTVMNLKRVALLGQPKKSTCQKAGFIFYACLWLSEFAQQNAVCHKFDMRRAAPPKKHKSTSHSQIYSMCVSMVVWVRATKMLLVKSSRGSMPSVINLTRVALLSLKKKKKLYSPCVSYRHENAASQPVIWDAFLKKNI